MSIFGVFLSIFSHIRTEYEDLLRKSPYSVQVRGNRDQQTFFCLTAITMNLRKTYSEKHQPFQMYSLQRDELIGPEILKSFL